MSPRTSRLDPRLVRQVLAYAENNGPVITARTFSIDTSTVYRWKGYRAEKGPEWPTDQDIADWDAKAHERKLNAARKRSYNQRRHLNRGPVLIDATGTIRRLQAMAAVGHSQWDIGAQLNLSGERISQLMRGRHKLVFPKTAQAVAKLHRRWAMTPSTGRGAVQVRNYAARQGWVSAIFWDNIDDPACRPSHTRKPPARAKAAA